MSKDFCMVAGCVEHATEYVELVTESENKEVLTIVHICASCESLLSDYFSDDKPISFAGFPIENVCILHAEPDAEGIAETDSVWFMVVEDSAVDAYDGLNVGLFDKEPFAIESGLVDVESYD